jgi:hypothetical protein
MQLWRFGSSKFRWGTSGKRHGDTMNRRHASLLVYTFPIFSGAAPDAATSTGFPFPSMAGRLSVSVRGRAGHRPRRFTGTPRTDECCLPVPGEARAKQRKAGLEPTSAVALVGSYHRRK